MEKKQLKLWRDYLASCDEIIDEVFPLPEVLLNAQLNPSNLFEFLVEHREDWENVQAAAYLDSIKEIKVSL